jgi:KaiC/GvpD/RAD55 family RecA-like ATPase
MKLIETYIAGFDEFCNGGLPPGVIIVYGVPGSGSEVFTQQVYFNRIQKGTNVTYFSTMKSRDSVKNDMAVYGLEISTFKKKGNCWRFVEGRQSKSIINLIQTELKEKRWIAIDSFSDILLRHDLESAVQLLNTMSSTARKNRGLYFALLTKGMHDLRVETAMLHFADGVIDFIVTEGSHDSERKMVIKKMRGSLISDRSLPFAIEETGLTIETAGRIT